MSNYSTELDAMSDTTDADDALPDTTDEGVTNSSTGKYPLLSDTDDSDDALSDTTDEDVTNSSTGKNAPLPDTEASLHTSDSIALLDTTDEDTIDSSALSDTTRSVKRKLADAEQIKHAERSNQNRRNFKDLPVLVQDGAKGKIAILKRDFDTLKGTNWLNDTIINAYTRLIQTQANSSGKIKKVWIASTHFKPILETATDLSALTRKWVKVNNIFELDYLIIPMHVNANHWCCAIVDTRSMRVHYYDPKHDPPNAELKFFKNLFAWINSSKPGQASFKEHIDIIAGPRQENDYDCGVFVVQFIKQFVLAFEQKDIESLRSQMGMELQAGELFL